MKQAVPADAAICMAGRNVSAIPAACKGHHRTALCVLVGICSLISLQLALPHLCRQETLQG